MDEAIYDAARAFVYRDARVLERRLFAALFEGVSPTGVIDALRGYRNADGGFGHGLEPDKRCPASQPLDVEVAFDTLAAAGAVDRSLVREACDYLASVADADGAVPLATPAIEDYPHAEHWGDWAYVPGLNPTAGLAGLLHRLDVTHPWVDAATAYCWAALDDGLPEEAHALKEVCVFLEHVPDRSRAEALMPAVANALPRASWFRADPDAASYGVTPLHVATEPTSLWRAWFGDDLIAGHLERLRRDQQPDGGWALTWEPPSNAATLDYRGVETLRALRVLRAYDR